MSRQDTEVLPVVGRFVGNYVLASELGRGATSEVFAAKHRFLGHPVAVKLMHSKVADLDRAAGAFLAEAKRTRTIDHPNVVRVLDFGRDNVGGFLYLVMEKLDGETLATRLSRVSQLDEVELRRIGAQLADGMAAAHDAGVIHRDLKPANVVLVDGDRPTIVDFGMSKHVEGESALATGPRLGTPAYMAPEQIAGTTIGPAADVWGLGVLLFEAATGQLPFSGFENGVSPQLVETPPRPSSLATLSPELEGLILACLERDPTRRPATMAEVAARLRQDPAAMSRRSVAAAAAPHARRAWLAPRIYVPILILLVIAVLGALRAMRASDPVVVPPPPSAPTVTESAGTPGDAAPADPSSKQNGAIVDAAVALADAPPASPSSPTRITSSPVGADIVVNGKHAGVTPAVVPLTFPSTIEIQRPGYQTRRVVAKQPGAITVRLATNGKRRTTTIKRPAGETLD